MQEYTQFTTETVTVHWILVNKSEILQNAVT